MFNNNVGPSVCYCTGWESELINSVGTSDDATVLTYECKPEGILTYPSLICIGDKDMPKYFVRDFVLAPFGQQKTILELESAPRPLINN